MACKCFLSLLLTNALQDSLKAVAICLLGHPSYLALYLETLEPDH